MTPSSAMEPQEELLGWAEEQKIELNGIRPQPFAGRGIGIITTRKVEENEVILRVPVRCLRTIETVPRDISSRLPRDLAVHGLLAAELALDTSPKHAKWNAVMPTRSDLRGMPLVWPPALQALLPRAAASLLHKQQAKLARDWAAVARAFPDLPEEAYRHAWLLVNTRTFYHVSARTEQLRLPRPDRLALQPVADLFNHADAGCDVAFDDAGFAIAADRAYAAGEEVHICYGRHSNDFLLVEYGFVLRGNRWDEVSLDDAVLPALTARQRQLLDEAGFLGEYVMDAGTVCHRTQVALRLVCTPQRDWQEFVDGTSDGEKHQRKADELLVSLLEKYGRFVEQNLASMASLELDTEDAFEKELLEARWTEIKSMLDSTIKRLTA